MMILTFLLLVGGMIAIAIIAKKNNITRDKKDEMIAGVCAGIAKKFGVKPLVVRAAFVISLVVWGFGVLPYIILWIVLEEEE